MPLGCRQRFDASGEADFREADVFGLVHCIPFDTPSGVQLLEFPVLGELNLVGP